MTPIDEYGTSYEKPVLTGDARPLGEKSPSELEAEISQIRAEMDTTLNDIERRFSPGEMLDRALHGVKGGPNEFAANLAASIRENPIPAAMIGVGVAWLLLSETGAIRATAEKTGEWKSESGRPTSRMAEKIHEKKQMLQQKKEEKMQMLREKKQMLQLKRDEKMQKLQDRRQRLQLKREEKMHALEEKKRTLQEKKQMLQEKGHMISDRLHHTADVARSKGHALKETTDDLRHRAQQVQGNVKYMIDEQPLLLVAVGMAVGVLLGGLLPITRREKKILGETGAEIRSKAKEFVAEQKEKVSEVVGAAKEAAREETERQFH